MSDISEKVRVAMYAKLNVAAVVGAGKATAVYNKKAPEGATFPYIIFQRQAAGPVVYSFGPTLVLEDDLWLVKVVTDEDASTTKEPQEHAEDILALAETALGTDLTLTGNDVVWLKRAYDMPEYEETQGDRFIYHRGSVYRIATE